MEDNTSYPLHDLLASHRRTFSEKLRFLMMHHGTGHDGCPVLLHRKHRTHWNSCNSLASAQSTASTGWWPVTVRVKCESYIFNLQYSWYFWLILELFVICWKSHLLLWVGPFSCFSLCLFLATDKVILLIFKGLYTVNQRDDAHKTPSGHQPSPVITPHHSFMSNL